MLVRSLAVITLSVSVCLPVSCPAFAGTTPLAAKQVVVRTCTQTSPGVFTVDLPKGATARLIVEQLNDDLGIRIISPDGATRKVDGFDFGAEPVTIVAKVSGFHRIEIAPLKPQAARASIYLDSISPAGAVNDEEAEAEDAGTECKQKAHDGTDWNQVLELTRGSLARWNRLERKDSIARTHLKLGDLYYRTGTWDLARDEYQQAEKLCNKGDFRCLAEAANNSGLSFLQLSELESAKRELDAAQNAWRRVNLPMLAGITNSNIALLDWESGEFGAALERFGHARRLFHRRNPIAYARTLNNIALVYMSTANYEKASAFFLEALAISSLRKDALPVLGRVRINLGRARMLSGRLEDALRDEQMAVDLFTPTEDVSGLAEALNNLGQVQLRRSRVKEARQALEIALPLYERIKDQRGLSSALHHLGVLALRQGDLSEARSLLRRSLQIREDRGLKDDAAETGYQLALVARQAGQLEECLSLLQESIKEVESLRARAMSRALRQSYFVSKQKYGEFYIEALLAGSSTGRDGAAAKSFEAWEQARVRSLIDVLTEDEVPRGHVGPELISRRRLVRRRLNYESDKLAKLPAGPERASAEERLRRRIAELLEEDADIEAAIDNQDPALHLIRNPHIVSAAETRADLSGNDLLFEYLLGDSRSYLWIFDRGQVRVLELPPRALIEDDARLLVDLLPQIQERKSNVGKEALFQRTMARLASVLHLSLAGYPSSPRVVIVPDGLLNRVPFAILPVSYNSSRSGRRPLGLICELVQVPSASVFHILTKRQNAAPLSLDAVAAFTDPVFDGLDPRIKRNAMSVAQKARTEFGGLPLARLPFSEVELEPVKRLLPPAKREVMRGFGATKAALFAEGTSRFPILLLSTHGIADDRQPELSSIVLTMIDHQGHSVDGLVHLYELYALRFHSLVILSACETASGKQVRGEGLIGMARGFLETGASGLLAAPGRVDAEASAWLVRAFLEQMLQPGTTTPAGALLKARRILASSKRWSDPYYWGSFVLFSSFSPGENLTKPTY